jgi:MoaA/NifB/PqqE/SkfB family radical SAM enzyme
MSSDVHGAISNFNSFKSLAHYERMQGALTGNYRAPVTVEIDPVVACNHGCWFCIAEQFMAKTPTKEKIADSGVIMNYMNRFPEWGVKGIVFVGGGEPTLHPDFADMVRHAHASGLEIGLITNGSRLNRPDVMSALKDCARWIGVSFDAATRETHKKLHIASAHDFDSALNGMQELALAGKAVTLKYVLSPWNLEEAPHAIELASAYNIPEVYYRPAYMGLYDNTPALQERAKAHGMDWLYNPNDPDGPASQKQFWIEVNEAIRHIEAHLESFNSKVEVSKRVRAPISKKKVEDFLTGNRSPKCYATPLLCVMSGDGKVHLCCDRREEDFLTLCDYTKEDMIELWGSDRHKAIIESINVKACPRCRLEIHNQIIHSMNDDTLQVNFI